MLQFVAVAYSMTHPWGPGVKPIDLMHIVASMLQCVAVCCSVLQCVAVCCKCVAVNCGEINPIDLMTIVANVLQRVAECCSVWQCVAVSRSVLQCVVVCSIELRLRKAD